MEEKEVEVNEKKFVVKEIKYKDFVEKAGQIDQDDKSAAGKVILLLSTNLSDEEYDNLSMKEGLKLMDAVNELNGIGDFQNPKLTEEL